MELITSKDHSGFILADGGTFNVVKEEFADDPDCPSTESGNQSN